MGLLGTSDGECGAGEVCVMLGNCLQVVESGGVEIRYVSAKKKRKFWRGCRY